MALASAPYIAMVVRMIIAMVWIVVLMAFEMFLVSLYGWSSNPHF